LFIFFKTGLIKKVIYNLKIFKSMEFEKSAQDQIFDYLREIIFNENTKITYYSNIHMCEYKLNGYKGCIIINHKPSKHGFLMPHSGSINLTFHTIAEKYLILNSTLKKDDIIQIKIYEKQNKLDESLNLRFFEFMIRPFPEKNEIYASFSGEKLYIGTIENVELIKVSSRYREGNKLFTDEKFLAEDGNASTEQQREYFRLIKEYATQQYSPKRYLFKNKNI